MKRHWPRVFSSFRCSKRRSQQLTVFNDSLTGHGGMETARNGDDDSMDIEEPDLFPGPQSTVIEINASPSSSSSSNGRNWNGPISVGDETDEEAVPPNGSFFKRRFRGGSLQIARRSQHLSANAPSSMTCLFSSKHVRRACASIREGKKSFLVETRGSVELALNGHSLNASPSSQHRTPTAEETGPSSAGGGFTHRSLSQSNSSSSSSVKANYIVEELLTTERSYVRELNEVVRFYMEPFGSPENSSALPPRLRGQSDMVFGNLRELANFHGACVLPEMERCSQSPSHLCHVLINRRGQFLALYRSYCQRSQNKSTAANGEGQQQLDQCAFFADCQRRAGHLLPLSSYLLKPIQRVTKYQLLLKELLRHCADSDRPSVQAALASMLDLLAQINSEMQQLHILGYSGDLRQLGPLRLQMECECYNFRRKTRRVGNKPKKRHLFLFDGGVLFCKRRAQPPPNNDPEYFEHKLCIAMHNLGFTAPSTSTSAPSSPRFELWDVNRSDGYAIQSSDEKLRSKWLQKLSQLSLPTSPTHSALSAAGGMHRPPIDAYSCFQMPPHTNKAVQPSTGMQQRRPSTRPQSWSSEESFKSVSSGRSSDTSALDEGNFCTPDSNGNNCFVPQRPQPQTVLCSKAANTPTANRGDRPFEWSSASGQVDVGHVTNIRIPTGSSTL